jgi:hypothetical protein
MNTSYVYPSAQYGEFRLALLYGTGPASYAPSTGDPVYNAASNEYIDFPMSVLSLSGNYEARFFPTSAGVGSAFIRAGAPSPSQSGWNARYFFTNINGGSGVGSVTNSGGSGMTAGTYALSFSGGGGSGAAGTITVSTSAVTATVITNPGTGYTSAPTVSAATGGTPPTLTSHLSVAGAEVAAGANLTGESFQFGGFVSQL